MQPVLHFLRQPVKNVSYMQHFRAERSKKRLFQAVLLAFTDMPICRAGDDVATPSIGCEPPQPFTKITRERNYSNIFL